MLGTIKAVKLDRGFGFIEPSEHGPDLFFHFRALIDLEFSERLIGQRVEYSEELDSRTGKFRAANVRPAI
jgi:cold shock CspA family protein